MLPESLQIALWAVSSLWLLAVLALLLGLDAEVVWTAVASGAVVGVWQSQARRRDPS
jgi:hypothetical protein